MKTMLKCDVCGVTFAHTARAGETCGRGLLGEIRELEGDYSYGDRDERVSAARRLNMLRENMVDHECQGVLQEVREHWYGEVKTS